MGFLSDIFDPGKDAREAGQAAAEAAALQNFNVTGPGGTASFDPGTGNVQLGLDAQTQALQQGLFGQAAQQQGFGQQQQQFLNQLGRSAIGGIGGVQGGGQFQPGQLPITSQGLPQFQQQTGPTAGLFGGQGSPFGGGGPFDPNRGLARQLNQGAAGLIGSASQDIGGAEADALARLRAQAAPGEREAFSNLNERLFGTGQGAVTGNADVELGGGRLAQAFARGQGQADLDRQVQAQGLAIQRRGADQAGLQGLLGASQGVQGTQEALRQGQFGRQLGAGQFGENQLQNLFGRQLGAAQFGQGQQGQAFNQALQGSGQLFGQNLQAGQFGQNVNQQNFQQQLAQQGFNNQALQQMFGIGGQLQGAQQAQQGANIQNQLALQQAGLGLNQLPQNLFGLGLQGELGRSNALLGGSQAQINAAAATPNVLGDLAGGFLGAAGAAGGFSSLFSDRRLKDNLVELMDEPNTGLKIYAWDWNEKGQKLAGTEPPIGLIAQEVQEKYPEAVVERHGYLSIDYKALIEATGA